jgi:DNA-binding CsgD family transcriptional regulator
MASEEIARGLSLAAEGVVVLPEELLIPGLIAKGLTIAQLEILSLSASGLSKAQMARRLSLSQSAVQWHLRGAYEALGLADEAQVARIFSVGGGGNGVKCGKKQCTRAKIA